MKLHRFDIIAALRKRGSSLAAVGRAEGLHRKTMSWALFKPHARANRAIARAIGQPMHVLWPQWFDEHGNLRNSPSARTPRRETAPSRRPESKPAKSKREAA